MWQNNRSWWFWWRLYKKLLLHLLCKVEFLSNKTFTKKEEIVPIHVLIYLLDFILSILYKLINCVRVFLFFHFYMFAALVTGLQLPFILIALKLLCIPHSSSGYLSFPNSYISTWTSRWLVKAGNHLFVPHPAWDIKKNFMPGRAWLSYWAPT